MKLGASLVAAGALFFEATVSARWFPGGSTYGTITPSPHAKPTPITVKHQLVTSQVPRYVQCRNNKGKLHKCTTIYQPTVYNWASTDVACYKSGHLTTAHVFEYHQPITFSTKKIVQTKSLTYPRAGKYTYTIDNKPTVTSVRRATTIQYPITATGHYKASFSAMEKLRGGCTSCTAIVGIEQCSNGLCSSHSEYLSVTVKQHTTTRTATSKVYFPCASNTTITHHDRIITVTSAPTTVVLTNTVISTQTIDLTATITSTGQVTVTQLQTVSTTLYASSVLIPTITEGSISPLLSLSSTSSNSSPTSTISVPLDNVDTFVTFTEYLAPSTTPFTSTFQPSGNTIVSATTIIEDSQYTTTIAGKDSTKTLTGETIIQSTKIIEQGASATITIQGQDITETQIISGPTVTQATTLIEQGPSVIITLLGQDSTETVSYFETDYITQTAFITQTASYTETTSLSFTESQIASFAQTATFTTIIDFNASGYTSSIPASGTNSAEVLVDVPSASPVTITSTTYVAYNADGFTSSIPASSTHIAEVIVGIPSDALLSTMTSTTYINYNLPGYTSTIPASGTDVAEILVGVPSKAPTLATTTTYLGSDALPYTTLVSSTIVVIGIDETFVTTTKTLAAGETSYLSTVVIPSDSTPGTIEIGVPTLVPIYTTYQTVASGYIAFTSSARDDLGDVSILIAVPTSTPSIPRQPAQPPAVITTTTMPAAQFTNGLCLNDTTMARVLTTNATKLGYESTNTPAGCADFCYSQGFPYSGTEWAKQCWCGDQIRQYTSGDINSPSYFSTGFPVIGPIAPYESCIRPCTGDKSQTCGGYGALQVMQAEPLPEYTYVTKTTTSGTSPATTFTQVIASGVQTGTILVILPSSALKYTTFTTFMGSDSPRTTTLNAAGPSVTGTIEIISPLNYTTFTTFVGSDSPRTTTPNPADSSITGTIEIISPLKYTTFTTFIGSDSPRTTTLNAAGASNTGTIDIINPLQWTTVTTYSGQDAARMTTFATAVGSTVGTVEIISPLHYITKTITSGSVLTTVTIKEATYTSFGTIDVFVPTSTSTFTDYTTFTTNAGQDASQTTTLANPDAFGPATVEIINPLHYVTKTVTSGSVLQTLTVKTASYTSFGTIDVFIPTATPTYTTVTTYVGTSAPYTTIIQSAVGSTPGTVEIVDPLVYTTITITSGSSLSSIVTLATASGSITGTMEVILPTPVYTTIYTTYGTGLPVTNTYAPTSGQITGTKVISLPTPALNCNNQGLQYAIYNNPFQIDAGVKATTNYTAFSPEYFKTKKPYDIDTTLTLGFVNQACGSNDDDGNCLYNSNMTVYKSNTKTLQVAVNHRVYFFAQQDGVYKFNTSASDDITTFWMGPTAYVGWTRGNANIVQPYVRPQDNSIAYTANLVAGNYYPFRIVFGNGIQVARFYFEVTGPQGNLLVDSSTTGSKYLVQNSCDMTTTPPFPLFGSEI